jgi:large subunit ribosomal protein L21
LLAFEGEKVEIGKPLVKKAKVSAKVLSQVKGEKLIVFKYKPKKNERTKTGHRQKLTQIKIEKIVL